MHELPSAADAKHVGNELAANQYGPSILDSSSRAGVSTVVVIVTSHQLMTTTMTVPSSRSSPAAIPTLTVNTTSPKDSTVTKASPTTTVTSSVEPVGQTTISAAESNSTALLSEITYIPSSSITDATLFVTPDSAPPAIISSQLSSVEGTATTTKIHTHTHTPTEITDSGTPSTAATESPTSTETPSSNASNPVAGAKPLYAIMAIVLGVISMTMSV